jgi:phosphoglycolate phosphatase-like HAD superfamily hydrolase
VAVAVTTGQHTRDELLVDRPDHLFDDLGDVERVLEVILGG